MPFTTYRETRPWAKAIRDAALSRKMPPWLADPAYGHFANDRSLSSDEIRTLAAWANNGAPEGDPKDRPPNRTWPQGWSIGQPDRIFEAPQSFKLPASGAIDYQYLIIPTGFTEDRWIQAVEVRPTACAAVHHAVVYIRPPGSQWLKDRPRGVAFSLPRSFTTNDILLVYAPGNAADGWPTGMAKKIEAGSDLILQIHYTATGQPTEDRPRIGLVFAKQPPTQAILTLQIGNSSFVIPPGDPNYRVQASGTLPGDALLIALFPHMHLRGKAFEYLIAQPNGRLETLLKIPRYDFHWQLSYRLAEPRRLRAGTRLLVAGYFDNSANNPGNPDPTAEVRFGEQSWEEMMIGFFDVAVDARLDKQAFFDLR
jgi:hypothetical protein